MAGTRMLTVYTTCGQLCILPSWVYTEEEAGALSDAFRDAFGLSAHTMVDQTIVSVGSPMRLSVPLPADPNGQPYPLEAAKYQLVQHLNTLHESLCAAVEVV